jgi:hypothetical protein
LKPSLLNANFCGEAKAKPRKMDPGSFGLLFNDELEFILKLFDLADLNRNLNGLLQAIDKICHVFGDFLKIQPFRNSDILIAHGFAPDELDELAKEKRFSDCEHPECRSLGWT